VELRLDASSRLERSRRHRFRVPTRADVDDVFRDMIDAGYRGLQKPYDAPWGARYAVIEDPDGIAEGLMSPISPDKKARPPDL
jgi:hypothetical protein